MLMLGSCAVVGAAPTPWREDADAAIAEARSAGADTLVYFALPGRDLSDRMEQASLSSEPVLAALQRHGFHSVRIDGFAQAVRYDQWVGGGEGMGVCVLDAAGRCYAARPGPQDPPEIGRAHV